MELKPYFIMNFLVVFKFDDKKRNKKKKKNLISHMVEIFLFKTKYKHN